jgi:hypothetical protein
VKKKCVKRCENAIEGINKNSHKKKIENRKKQKKSRGKKEKKQRDKYKKPVAKVAIGGKSSTTL